MAQVKTQPADQPPRRKLGKAFAAYSAHIWGPLLSGMVGLILSVVLLLGWPFDSTNRFHEIDLCFENANATSLHFLDTSITHKYLEDSTRYEQALAKKLKDTETIKKRVDSLKKQATRISIRKFEKTYRRTDTFLLDAKRLTLNPGILENIINDTTRKRSVTFGYYEPEFSQDVFTFENPVEQKEYYRSMTFFKKYPRFAFWLFLGILQMVMWMLMVPICISAYNNIRDLHKKAGTDNRRGKSFLFAGIALAIFCLILYAGIIDVYAFLDNHFMRQFNARTLIYSAIGYLMAFLSLAGYLYLTDTLNQLQKPLSRKAAELEDKKVALTVAAANEAIKLAAIETDPEIVQLTADKKMLEEQFKQAKTFFNLFLGMSALVLSVMILWIASMFNAVNSLEIFRYYKAVSGYNFWPNDFVYLFGGLHSILLAIFVAPAKFKIMEINASFPDAGADGNSNSTLSGIMKNIGATLREVLVVSSPLLAGILQNVVQSLFN